jgi:hypothetical protein
MYPIDILKKYQSYFIKLNDIDLNNYNPVIDITFIQDLFDENITNENVYSILTIIFEFDYIDKMNIIYQIQAKILNLELNIDTTKINTDIYNIIYDNSCVINKECMCNFNEIKYYGDNWISSKCYKHKLKPYKTEEHQYSINTINIKHIGCYYYLKQFIKLNDIELRIHEFILHKDIKFIKCLMDDNVRLTPLSSFQYASYLNCLDIVILLLSYLTDEQRERLKQKNNSIKHAYTNNNPEMLKLLLQYKCYFNIDEYNTYYNSNNTECNNIINSFK